VERELPPLQRLAQLALEPPPGADLRLHRRLEEPVLAPALRLGAVECQLGMLEQCIGVLPVLREQGHTDAGRDLELLAGKIERRRDRSQDLVGQGDYVRAAADLRLHEQELVATQPGQGVGGTDHGVDPLGYRAQQPIAQGMAQSVVDVLEAVEVEQEHGDHAAFAASMGQLLAEPVMQQGTVGQPGEPVVQGQPPNHPRTEAGRSSLQPAQDRQIVETDRHGISQSIRLAGSIQRLASLQFVQSYSDNTLLSIKIASANCIII